MSLKEICLGTFYTYHLNIFSSWSRHFRSQCYAETTFPHLLFYVLALLYIYYSFNIKYLYVLMSEQKTYFLPCSLAVGNDIYSNQRILSLSLIIKWFVLNLYIRV